MSQHEPVMNPYEADPTKIPENDLYADVPFYGRYLPRPEDFRPSSEHINSTTPESLQYWESVLKLHCDQSTRIYENTEGGRDVFAVGSVIIKSSHLNASLQGRRACRDYSLADANEVHAISLARETLALGDIAVPEIYFADKRPKINGRAVLVQSRVPGVGLTVAWPYLNAAQKASFKEQARSLLRRIATIQSPFKTPSYVVPDQDPVAHRGIQTLEKELIFDGASGGDLSLMHNDTTLSNIIVNDDRIIAIVDWEMAGFFGWTRAANVHVQIRTPKREWYAHLGLGEDVMADILYWNDLYDVS
ncbi:MAG: hypothetical protein M1819_004720 [Sarea resinae]|nr:MAG: hypothetical protein M1819_004720 [Sarea resinae]